MTIRSLLLYPFSLIFDGITRVRNHLYDIGHKKSFRFETMVISVGNLNLGGSGKTPMIEYLIRLLNRNYRIATLSRGYGRNTRGLRFASQNESTDSIGDEPFQLFRKFGPAVTVAVGEERAFAIPHLLQLESPPDIILLDDAFQHRPVDPQLSILLTDFHVPFYKDFVLPGGGLREARTGARRSHVVVVTRTPAGTAAEVKNTMRAAISKYAPQVPVFFAEISYDPPVGFGSAPAATRDIVLVTGIANGRAIHQHVASNFNLLKHFEFNDHHRYGETELQAIHGYTRRVGQHACILTTEKDMVKLIGARFKKEISSNPWFYIPIRLSFQENGSEFDTLVNRSVEKAKQNGATVS